MFEISALNYAMLGLLQTPMSGYAIRKVFATTPMANYSSSPGSIYPALQRLREHGLIKGVIDSSRPLRPKEVFALTSKGKAELNKWLLAPVTREDTVRNMDQLILRFAFMNSVGQQETATFLKSLIRELEPHIAALEQYLVSAKSRMPKHGWFAVEYGIGGYKAQLRWAKRALAEFQ